MSIVQCLLKVSALALKLGHPKIHRRPPLLLLLELAAATVLLKLSPPSTQLSICLTIHHSTNPPICLPILVPILLKSPVSIASSHFWMSHQRNIPIIAANVYLSKVDSEFVKYFREILSDLQKGRRQGARFDSIWTRHCFANTEICSSQSGQMESGDAGGED